MAGYYYRRKYGSLGYFSTTGTTDPLLYHSPSRRQRIRSPDSNGWIGRSSTIYRQNVKLALQYTFYDRFNGSSTNYDVSAENASGNNTLFVLGWVAF